MTYLKYLLYVVAALIVLPLTGCFCSQLYTQHQVAKLMTYQGMSKDDVLRRVCETEGAEHGVNPADGDSPSINIQVFAHWVSGKSYDALKDNPDLRSASAWVVHGRSYGLATRHYAVKLTFNESGIVTHQELTWYVHF